MRKVYAITDLGPGDGGKGGVVHKIASMTGAHTVAKVGGAQGSHGVVNSSGARFAFQQFGCGTLEGVQTHITHRLVIDPHGLLHEEQQLRYQCGIHNAFDLLTVDESAICITLWHQIASRLTELARGNNPRGTIGSGVGQGYRDSQRFPDLIIRSGNLLQGDLRDRLAAVREQKLLDLTELTQASYNREDWKEVAELIEVLRDPGYVDVVLGFFQEVAKRVKIVDKDYFAREVLSRDGVVVVESSHGVLTDNLYGFHPHTSAIRTLPRFTDAMLEEADYAGKVVHIGVTRGYTIRHGAGPMPTADPEMVERLLPGSNKNENRYQGKVRIGPLDLVLLRYAIEVCGGPTKFDGLAVTWFDQLQKNREWQWCNRYKKTDDLTCFTPEGAIEVRSDQGLAQYAYQEELGQQLLRCAPEITACSIPSSVERGELFDLCASVLGEKLGVPVRMVSFGPTERDKMCK